MDHSQVVAAGAKGSGVHEALAPLSRMGPSKAVCSLLGCRLSASALVVPTPPHIHGGPHPQAGGDVSEHVGSAFQAPGGDTTMVKALLSPCSLGTCLVGGGDG